MATTRFKFRPLLAFPLGLFGSMAIAGGWGESGLAPTPLAGWLAFAPAVLLIFACTGIGSLARPLLRGAREITGMEQAIGIAAFALLATLLLGTSTGLIASVALWVFAGSGLGIAVWRGFKDPKQPTAEPGNQPRTQQIGMAIGFLALGAWMGFAYVCVSHAPGTLWDSEFGGFDALSYHLQLPQEWLARGRVGPLDHNVYSFLPSSMEVLYTALGVATRAPLEPAFPNGPIGLLAGTGWRVLACQAMHAVMAFAAAGVVGAAARRAMGVEQSSGVDRGAIAFMLTLFTPWVLVTGTLAYNEMPMVLCFAGAVLVALEDGLPAIRRGTFAGLLVGAACAFKPTALLFCGVPVGLLLLGTTPVRDWWRIVIPGALAGVLPLAPWLVRNWHENGNPVFPMMAAVFGNGHWDAWQVANFARHHVSQEPLITKLKLLLVADATDPAGPRHRGMLHPQWGVFFPLVLIGAGHAAYWLRGREKRVAVLLVLGMVAQLAAWLFTTHVQSRFLMPMVVPGAILVAMAVKVSKEWLVADRDTRMGAAGTTSGAGGDRRATGEAAVQARTTAKRFVPDWFARIGHPATIVLAVLGIAAQACVTAYLFGTQNRGRPNAMLALTPAEFTATGAMNALPEERAQLARALPQVALAFDVPPGERVYLLGDTAPLYYPPNVVYHTVWDPWLFKDGELTDPSIRYVLVNLGEIERFERSGYLPPTVTLDGVRRWMATRTRVLRTWDERGAFLVRVNDAGRGS